MLRLSDGNVNLLINDERLRELGTALGGLAVQADVLCVLLVDAAGRRVASAGRTERIDADTVAALAAGDLASSRALARRVGERAFSLLFQRDREINVFLAPAGEEAILIVLFSQEAPLAAVMGRVREAERAVARTLAACERQIVSTEALRKVFESPAAPSSGAVKRIRREFAMGQVFEVVEEVSEAPPMETPLPTERPAPPPELVRRFWRVRTLAEDCVRSQVAARAPDLWQQAGRRIARVAQLMVQAAYPECVALLEEAERFLLAGYERTLAAQQGTNEDWELVEFFHHLVAQSSTLYESRLGAAAREMIRNVDREVQERHPALLREANGGMVEPAALDAARQFPRTQRRRLIVHAFLDLLLRRISVARTIFGDPAFVKLRAAWTRTFQERAVEIGRHGLTPALRWFLGAVDGHRDGTAGGRTR